jgi:two-component system, OmpR family, response regulator RpaB
MVALQLRALARLIATDPPAGEPETITVRNLTIDLVQRLVRAGTQEVDLTPTEFLLLAHLARRRGVVSHTELVRELHGGILNEREAKNMLKVHIWRLRAKLAEALPDTNLIVTVRGFGYLLERRSGSLPHPPRASD